jgi:ISXO2-like transposase domain
VTYIGSTGDSESAEGFFSIFKRGMKGVYQHCSEKHLHRYLAEFDFRYSNRVKLGVNDEQRAARMVKGVTGKHLSNNSSGQTPSRRRDELGAPPCVSAEPINQHTWSYFQMWI